MSSPLGKRTNTRVISYQGYYPTGTEVTDAELAALPLHRYDWHGEWNYDLTPPKPRRTPK